RRRPVLIATDVARAISLLSIPVAFALDSLTIWQLYLVVFVNGCLTVFFDVSWQSYLPSIVERDQLVDGNSKLELTRTSSQRLGPGAAGLLIGLFQAPFAIVLDALSYLWSAVFVLLIRRAEPPVAPHDTSTGARPSMRADIAAGLRYVTGHRWLRALALSVAASYLFGQIADSILVLYLVTERGFSAALVGFAFTIGSIGVIGGALVAGRGPVRRADADDHGPRVLRRLLERERSEPPPGDHAPRDARPDERDDALHRLERHPRWLDPRRLPRRRHRPPRDDLGRCDRGGAHLRPGRALVGPPPPRDAHRSGRTRPLTVSPRASGS
ncbi:MAG TPA: MFS transporter, partial [Candidatus Limnocylindrales bacterium]|nr:MFS transporter [Candidatus Limnocylindrales bacterium]